MSELLPWGETMIPQGEIVTASEVGHPALAGGERRVFLTSRDMEVLRWAHEQKFLLLSQVARWFSEASTEEGEVEGAKEALFPIPMPRRRLPGGSYLEARLRALCRQELLKRVPVYTERAPAVLPGRTGHEVLIGHVLDRGLARQEGIDWKNFAHDRQVTDLRWFFEKTLGATDWISERVLRKTLDTRLVPDAVVTLGGGRTLALELELTRKSVARYVEIIERYLDWTAHKLDLVLYVVPEKSELAFVFNEVLPAALASSDLWLSRAPDLSLFRFTTLSALRERRTWWTSRTPWSPEPGVL